MKTIYLLIALSLLTSCSSLRISPDVSTGSAGLRATMTTSTATTSSESISQLEREIEALRAELKKPEVLANEDLTSFTVNEIVRKKRIMDSLLAEQENPKPLSRILKDTFLDFTNGTESLKSSLALAGALAAGTYAVGFWDFDDINGKNDDRETVRKIQAEALQSVTESSQQRLEVSGDNNSVELRDLPQNRTVRVEITGKENDVTVDLQQSPTF